ncbi:hypothetical protein FRX31_008769 [Thalictrum thalictroides]|uniref:Uncharacterized protein n=1 Tax=Thalictrum thalictroides TaxID=46969 RepID=A0A7J6WYJ8_THATH|nr:hypothetical protein FRX31_008769 [Thalictrum thalictroides]
MNDKIGIQVKSEEGQGQRRQDWGNEVPLNKGSPSCQIPPKRGKVKRMIFYKAKQGVFAAILPDPTL